MKCTLYKGKIFQKDELPIDLNTKNEINDV